MAIVDLRGQETRLDVVALLAAAQVHRPDHEREAQGLRVAALYKANDTLRLYGCSEHNVILGLVGVEDRGGDRWFLRDLAVDESMRLRGIGRALLAFLEALPDAVSIEGDTLPPATAFYERCGWRVEPIAETLPDGRLVYRFRWQRPSA